MNQDAVVNKLLNLGVIERTNVRGIYNVCDMSGLHFRRANILARFAVENSTEDYRINYPEVYVALNRRNVDRAAQQEVSQQTRRHITRETYHCGERNYGTYLAQIEADEDGYVRSFGLEFEVYSLTELQEDKLARLLDTLPAHITERDGSLGDGGVEIVFMPMSAAKYIETVKTLQTFVRDNGVRMQKDEYFMAGMHTSYGLSKPGIVYPSKMDFQIRLNRFALAVKAVGTQPKIKALFGRDFGHYRELPNSTTVCEHSNAFSAHGRPETCWECRLLSWKCNVEKVVEFFKATEVAFIRPVEAQDFMKVFEVLGSDTDGQ